ncbi:universal stress protein [Mycobacterium sp. 852002-50816_SCH5313054-b]|uniref:universal stress protein n=1 Tax=Mycobacterium sp. 852002-50816_SCH5313054-b TaxID=1834092 RepID=UPI00080105C9|nr:universal stress protein [Mycobacterium sp. 852002-50816_SCH5313054-b]OBF53296.1 universal stress protein [Mycobacterium sp. 852002-50816_SCH5313054-b]
MNHPQAPARVVVGIDGSQAAINAAKWAITEAISRDVPLRLIHAVPDGPADETGDEGMEVGYAQACLRDADAALQATGKPVTVECDIVRGSPEGILVDESRRAAMICVGSVGISRIARKLLGSTADAIARKAQCPVTVVRVNGHKGDPGWVAVVVDDSPSNDAVLEHGFREARLRRAPILALGVWRWGLGEIPYRQLEHRLGPWVSRYPEVHVMPAAARRGPAEFLAHTQESVQLTVVGSEDADKLARMVGSTGPHLSGHAGCSVLVVRD